MARRKKNATAKQKENLNVLLKEEVVHQGCESEIQAIAAVANKKVRIVYTFGYGRYFCPNGHGWTSYRACITFDMKNLCVSKMWRQYCRSCPEVGVTPEFKATEQKAVVVDTIKRFFERINNGPQEKRTNSKSEVKPHLRHLCEVCRSGLLCL
ncbi:uncharacterized protein LOC111254840 [Varroa destructor]|uniref:3CxxC-type domain-containing protein n=1 Tax=Varroa destructor TaxID=109461 RepID=A0A7M7KZV5_VARDE|nr:uncharacterized protein LOC111254840 [Varroa destructor]XP_022671837.1 uncharacterized protein LOC111254840 [Varroa destructor]